MENRLSSAGGIHVTHLRDLAMAISLVERPDGLGQPFNVFRE
jgi:hypothetical protein